MSEQPYLLDALETSDMLVIDGLHAFDFQLDDELLDQADAVSYTHLTLPTKRIV